MTTYVTHAYHNGAALGAWRARREDVQRHLLRLHRRRIVVEHRHGYLLRVQVNGTSMHIAAHGPSVDAVLASCDPEYLESMLSLLDISTKNHSR